MVIDRRYNVQLFTGHYTSTPDSTSGSPHALLTFAMVGNGSTQSQAGIVPASMTTDASLFVEVIPQISRNIGVALTNPGNTINVVTLTLRDDDGIVVGTPATVTIEPKKQVAKFVNELFGTEAIGTGFIGSLRITSSTPFAALGLRFAVFSALPVTNLGPASAVPAVQTGVGGPNALVLGQFALAGGWATHVALVNNTNAEITGRIDIFDTSGNPLPVKLNGETKSTFTYSIPAGGTFVLAPRDANGQSPM